MTNGIQTLNVTEIYIGKRRLMESRLADIRLKENRSREVRALDRKSVV